MTGVENGSQSYKHHSDHPTLNDKLNRYKSVQNKARQIIHCKPPQVFGIHGDWGAGKTSYLHQLRYHLDGTVIDDEKEPEQEALIKAAHKKDVITVWFDAWRFQHEKAPVIALLHEIRRQYELWDKVKNSGRKLADVTVRTVLNSFSDIAKLLSFEAIPLKAQDIQKTGEKWEKDNLESKIGGETIQEFLEKAIDTLLKTSRSKKRLVIIIDDLDRCSPTAAYRLLEGLKVYLSLKNCVFVIGMNQQIVIEAIAEKLSEGRDLDTISHNIAAPAIRAEAYLEKMCSSIERLNPPFDTNSLLSSWIEGSEFRQNLTLAFCDDGGNAISCLPPNPRRLKALANLLNTWSLLLDDDKTQDEKIQGAQALLLIAYVYQFHGELFQRWSFTPSFYTQLKKWATEPWPTPRGGETRSDDSSWPPYLQILELPEKMTVGSSGDVTPSIEALSNYPDPYSANVFWIAPLLRYADLNEDEINPILKAVAAS
ncbi:KAP family P-loop NTPase fold protein [Thalassomonas haliotis]|uniref:KAP NTPase domain-containing protein n=1 Tax=Thalassomonas haliotis TaxID=485448 RepID=A0ABY7V9C7_9GAMM|nr:P-loop NTPase fold protein [Thalassomonas haliotis]WDE10126.1 hypothetical protein H3N35_17760 [Thalassomonas haliotis]